MRKISRKTVVVLGVTGAVLAGGIAYAAWTSSGSGSGSVQSSTAVNSTISPANSGTALYPGASTTFTVTVNNPNSYPVTVDSISAGSSTVVNTNCVAGSVTSDALTPGSNTIPGGGSATYTLTAHMIANADDSCQAQTFSLPLTAVLTSAAS